MRLQSASYILGAALCLTAPAWAQSTAITPTGTGTQTTSTGTQTTSSTSTGAFQNLSPGGQKIAQSLFDAQHPPTGTKAMTLDQIAALKGKEGWGRAFKEMKSDGLAQARNPLGRGPEPKAVGLGRLDGQGDVPLCGETVEDAGDLK